MANLQGPFQSCLLTTPARRSTRSQEEGPQGSWENVGDRGPKGAVQTAGQCRKGRLWAALWSSPTEMLGAGQTPCTSSWPGWRTSD